MIKSIKTFRHTHTPVARPDVANVYCNIFHFTFFQRFFCKPFFLLLLKLKSSPPNGGLIPNRNKSEQKQTKQKIVKYNIFQ